MKTNWQNIRFDLCDQTQHHINDMLQNQMGCQVFEKTEDDLFLRTWAATWKQIGVHPWKDKFDEYVCASPYKDLWRCVQRWWYEN